jgi:hypothetical protein
MPCAASQLTLTVPLAGWVNVNEYGPAPEPETAVVAAPLMSKSPASTPVTVSENVIATLVSEVTPEVGVGVVVVTVGAANIGKMPVHKRTNINGREDFMGGGGNWGNWKLGEFCQKSDLSTRLKFLSHRDSRESPGGLGVAEKPLERADRWEP